MPVYHLSSGGFSKNIFNDAPGLFEFFRMALFSASDKEHTPKATSIQSIICNLAITK